MVEAMDPEQKRSLRAAYRHFLKPGRILLTGHSHQAWPDVAREAQLVAFDEAAELVDDKWERVAARMDAVGRKINGRMGFAEDDPIAFGESTHQLVFRLLSCFLGGRPRVVTTGGEFHSLHRQLSRLAEAGFEVVWVDREPRETLADRVIEATTDGTAVVALSAVLFEDAWIVDGIDRVIAHASEVGALPIVDAYHAFNCVPIDWGALGDRAYVVAGGYKYAGFGNGICWLRFPRDCALRPVYTGWFADFASLSAPRRPGAEVRYGPGGSRFMGATFDASALCRAEAVLAHWDRFELDVPALRASYLSQTARIIEGLADLELVSSRDGARRAGFVTVRHPQAGAIVERLRAQGVFVDARNDLLRLGPAPYLDDDEIDRGLRAVVAAART
jgi:kynureninase